MWEKVGGKAPTIHRNHRVKSKLHLTVAVRVLCPTIICKSNSPRLDNINKLIFLICIADATVYRAMLRHGIAKPVAYHAELWSISTDGTLKMLICDLKRLSAIKIIRINHSKGLVYNSCHAKQCLRSTPWLETSLGQCEPFGQIIKLLKSVFHLYMLADSVSDGVSEIAEILLLDDKDNLIKACLYCIIDRKIYNKIAILVHRIDLLHSTVS